MSSFGNSITDYIPLFALIVGLISIILDTKHKKYRGLLIFFLVAVQVVICFLDITKNVQAKIEAEQQVDSLLASIKTFEESTQVNFDLVIALLRNARARNESSAPLSLNITKDRIKVDGDTKALITGNSKSNPPDYSPVPYDDFIYIPDSSVFKGIPNLGDVSNKSIEEMVFEEAPEEEVSNEVFMVVEDQPEPQGGMSAFYRQVGENMKYPSEAIENGIEGKVFVQFVVD